MTHPPSLAAARGLLSARGLDALLVSSPTNRRYLTGFSAQDGAPDESSGVLLLTADRATLFTGPNEREWAASEARAVDVEAWQRPWERFVAQAAVERGYRTIGFEDRALTVAAHSGLAAAQPELTWAPLGGALDAIRGVKSDAEIALLETAIAATDRVFGELTGRLAPGMTEAEVGWLIERLTRESGGAVAFQPIVASGEHAARPHHGVTGRPLQPGEPVIIDMGVAIAGYSGDLTRTIWLGVPTARLQEVYNAVDRAHAAALAEIRPGQTGRAVDQAARDALTASGLGDAIVHSVGHGLGLRVHEAPSVSIHSDDVLEVGQIFTVEPGAYLPGWGGVRIEDVVVVTADGYRVLSAAPKMMTGAADGSSEE